MIFQNGLKFQNITTTHVTTTHAITYTNTWEKLETIVMQNLVGGGGVNKVHYGLCENGAFCGHF